MKPIFILINWPLIVIFGKALLNWYQIEKQKKYPKHGIQIFIVAIIALLYQAWSGVNEASEWELALTILLYQATSYWFLFDAMLNLMRGKHLLYIGIPDKDDAVTDQFFFKYPSYYTWSKIVMIPLIIYSIVWITRLA